MDYFTHILFGALTAAVVIQPFNPALIILAGFMAGLPDFDVILTPLHRIYPSYYFEHRGGSHSLIIAIVMGAIMAAIFSPIVKQVFWITWIFATLFYCLHLFLDVLTTYRVPFFYPLYKKEFKFGFETAVNPMMMFISLGLLLYLMLYQTPLYPIEMEVIALIYYVYIFHRICMKYFVLHNASPGTIFIPGTLPLKYIVFQRKSSESSTEYLLTEHIALFKITKILARSEIINDSPEADWILLAMEIFSNQNRYRWLRRRDSVIPYVEDQGDKVKVVMYFAEMIFGNRSLIISVDFDKATKNAISLANSFGRLKNQ